MIRALLKAELRHHLRDRVTVATLVLGQGLVFPIVGFGLAAAQQAGVDRIATDEITVGVRGDIARLAPYADPYTHLVPADGGAPAADVGITLAPGTPFSAEVVSSPTARKGMTARRRATDLAQAAGEAERDAAFAAAGAPLPSRAVAVTETDVVPAAARVLRKAASAVPAMLLFLVASGGIYTALDVVTGEKERSTIETLLTTAVDRRQVAVAKFLVVLLLVLLASFVSLTSMFVTSRLPFGVALLGENAIPARAYAVAAVLFVPLAATVAALLTAAAARVPDFKSGQVYALPALVVPAGLAAVALLPDATLTPLVALIPISNLSVALREVLLGTARPGPLAICLVASTVYAGAALLGTTRWLGREDVLLGDRGGRHRRLRGDYVPDAALLFVIGLASLWFVAAPAQQADFVWGMAGTQVGLFLPLAFGAPYLLGLGVPETLGLRAPRAVDLALGVAAGCLCPLVGALIAEGQKAVLPASPEVMKVLDAMLPADVPLPLLLLIVAVAPGVCEELLFRGAVLGLLRRSLAPWIAIAATALAFGLFHTSLFRIVPTASLGLLFGAARLRSRSIVVPMVMHTLNNGLGVAAQAAGYDPGIGPACMLAVPAVVLLVAAMGRGRPSPAKA